MLETSLPAAAIAAFVCIVMLLAMRPMAASLGLIDKPGGRKRHVGHVPIIGGLCMFFGFIFGSLLVSPSVGTAFLLLGSVLLLLVGAIDDRHDVPPTVRLGAQFSAVLVMVFGGTVSVATLGDPLFFGEILVGRLSLPVTVILVLAVINAFNMTDGVDGLAGGLSLIAFVGIAVTSLDSTITGIAITGAAVVGGFLAFNFPLKMNRPIRTFMGDAGSTFLGYVIAWLCIQASQPPLVGISPVVALGFVALPLFDLTSCFFRRLLDGRSPLSADRNHFHHLLAEAGLSRRQILAVLLGSATCVAVLCFCMYELGASDSMIFVAWIASGVVLDSAFRFFRASHDRRALAR